MTLNDIMLQEHGTRDDGDGLKPVNIIQAAKADLRLKERKKAQEADAGEMYSFARSHVKRANSVGSLVALAWAEPKAANSTDKKSTYIVYRDRDLLRHALLEVLRGEES